MRDLLKSPSLEMLKMPSESIAKKREGPRGGHANLEFKANKAGKVDLSKADEDA